MDIDVESVKQALSAAGVVLGVFKQARELLPDGPNKDQINLALEMAERDLKLAESQAAVGMGYELCRSHFPPEIMHSKNDMNWRCPVCGNEKDTGPAVGFC